MSNLGIYILHVPGQKWRNECEDRVARVFGRFPICIQGFKPNELGYDLKDLPIAPTSQHKPVGHQWSDGHIGCVFGHRQILHYFLNYTDYPFAVIFEDDVTFHSWVKGHHFEDAGKRVSALDPSWDWMLVCNPYNWPSSTPTWIPDTQRLDNIFRCSQVSVGSHSYMVSRKGAEKLLQRTTPFTATWDVFTTDCSNARVYHGPELGCMPAHDTDCESIAN